MRNTGAAATTSLTDQVTDLTVPGLVLCLLLLGYLVVALLFPERF